MIADCRLPIAWPGSRPHPRPRFAFLCGGTRRGFSSDLEVPSAGAQAPKHRRGLNLTILNLQFCDSMVDVGWQKLMLDGNAGLLKPACVSNESL
jgi:hypothetical protein